MKVGFAALQWLIRAIGEKIVGNDNRLAGGRVHIHDRPLDRIGRKRIEIDLDGPLRQVRRVILLLEPCKGLQLEVHLKCGIRIRVHVEHLAQGLQFSKRNLLEGVEREPAGNLQPVVGARQREVIYVGSRCNTDARAAEGGVDSGLKSRTHVFERR